MQAEILNKESLLKSIDEIVTTLVNLTQQVHESKLNTVPYKDSWTAAQLLRHVEKSINGMANAMSMETTRANRDPGDRVEELKKIFLDFSSKMNSPEFIVPEERVYEKQASIDALKKSFRQFKENTAHADMAGLITNLPLGPITKWEILNFVLFHTQRHLHQMEKICAKLNK